MRLLSEEEELRVEETVQEPEPLEQQELITASVSATAKAVVPFVHLPPPKKRNNKAHHPVQRKKSRFFKKRESPTAVISPTSSSHNSEDELIVAAKASPLGLDQAIGSIEQQEGLQCLEAKSKYICL